jgi:uncharacterized protein (TIGR02453 family)
MKVSIKSLQFLKTLSRNNNREWFNAHKSEFTTIQNSIKVVYAYLFELLNTHDQVDAHKLFRIYRDVRFSKNKLPYKTHFGGSFHREKPQLRGGYYLHIAPNNESFIAVGFWEPNKQDLFRIRKEFEQDAEEMRELCRSEAFYRLWGNLKGEELKNAPRGFNPQHPNIDLIRKKQFIFTKPFADHEVTHKEFIAHVSECFKVVRPYFDYMSAILTTNLNGESIL